MTKEVPCRDVRKNALAGIPAKKMQILEECQDMLGEKLSSENKERIKKYLLNPTPDSWDDIIGIVVSGGKTIWQSVCAIDPTFPRSGRRYEHQTGKVLKEWERIPDPVLVARAIKNTIKEMSNLTV